MRKEIHCSGILIKIIKLRKYERARTKVLDRRGMGV
jgi:hypothetical protein